MVGKVFLAELSTPSVEPVSYGPGVAPSLPVNFETILSFLQRNLFLVNVTTVVLVVGVVVIFLLRRGQ